MYSTTQSIMLPNARHHSLYPFLLEIEECEDCYQKDQDENSDNEDSDSEEEDAKEKRCEICDRNAYHQNDWHCSQGLIGPKIKEWFDDEEEDEEEEEEVRRECFKCNKIYYDVEYSCCCGKCCSYCRRN